MLSSGLELEINEFGLLPGQQIGRDENRVIEQPAHGAVLEHATVGDLQPVLLVPLQPLHYQQDADINQRVVPMRRELEGEMGVHLGYEKNFVEENNTGNSRNDSYPKIIQTEHGESVISIPRDRNGHFKPIAVPKHESRGLSIEKLVISLYAKGMSVSDMEEEMRDIYEIELSTSAISIITNKVNQAA